MTPSGGGLYEELSSAADPARRVGWRDRLNQAARFEAVRPVVAQGASVIDLGCGEGALADYLDACGVRVAYRGVDRSPAMIARARAHAPGRALQCADVLTAPVSPAEVAVAIGAFVDGEVVLDEIARKRRVLAWVRQVTSLATKGAALVVLRQRVVEERVSLRLEGALMGATADELRSAAAAVGWSCAIAPCLTTDWVAWLAPAGQPTGDPGAIDVAARAVAGPWGAVAPPRSVAWLWVDAGRPVEARRVVDAVADRADRRLLREAIALLEHS